MRNCPTDTADGLRQFPAIARTMFFTARSSTAIIAETLQQCRCWSCRKSRRASRTRERLRATLIFCLARLFESFLQRARRRWWRQRVRGAHVHRVGDALPVDRTAKSFNLRSIPTVCPVSWAAGVGLTAKETRTSAHRGRGTTTTMAGRWRSCRCRATTTTDLEWRRSFGDPQAVGFHHVIRRGNPLGQWGEEATPSR